MSIESKHSSQKLAPLPPLAEIRNRLNTITCNKVAEICSDNKYRLENCKSDGQLLWKGIFYPHEYFSALKATNQLERIEQFKASDRFYFGYVSPEHFSEDVSKGPMMENCCGSFLLKKNVLPSEALKAVVEGPSLVLCGVVCQIARLLAVQEVLGTEKFDTLFAWNSTTPLKLGLNCPISRVTLNLECEYGNTMNAIEEGDLVHFPNHYIYRKKHTMGIAGAYNTICIKIETVGFQKITKFGTLGISEKGISYEEMNKLLLAEFNSEPDYALEYLAESTRQAVSKRFNYAAKTLKKENFESDFVICSRLNAEKIAALASSTLEQARMLLLA